MRAKVDRIGRLQTDEVYLEGVELLARSETVRADFLVAGVCTGALIVVDSFRPDDLAAALEGARAEGWILAILHPRWTREEKDRARAHLPAHWYWPGGSAAPSPPPESPVHLEVDAGVALFTSGTTGNPKPALLSMRNLDYAARASIDHLDFRPGDTWYGALTMAHVGGLSIYTRARCAGASAWIESNFDPGRLRDLILGESVNFVSLVPTMLARLLEVWGSPAVPASLRCLMVGGAGLSLDLAQRAQVLGMPRAPSYGQTETADQLCTLRPLDFGSK